MVQLRGRWLSSGKLISFHKEAHHVSEHNHVVSKDGSVTMNRVNDALDRIEPEQKEVILNNFQEFKSYLSKRIHLAQKSGSAMSSLP